jgi:hypothetical protein
VFDPNTNTNANTNADSHPNAVAYCQANAYTMPIRVPVQLAVLLMSTNDALGDRGSNRSLEDVLTYEDAALRCRLGDSQEFKSPSSAGGAVMRGKPATAGAYRASPRLRPRRGQFEPLITMSSCNKRLYLLFEDTGGLACLPYIMPVAEHVPASSQSGVSNDE